MEIIGWMYQYYNVEPKDETFALLKKNVKITKERIPAATQLFTPDWIVRYMVENSLGRLWVEGHPNDSLKANWKYYLEEAQQEQEVQAQLEKIRAEYKNLNPEDIKVIDPCMGSGHILVYCFDVLMQIYEAQGYTQRDAAQSILENNLYGLDIDRRAAQMAYFAVMMKARQYDRRIFGREITPHVYAIEESNGFNREQLKYFGASLNPMERNTALIQAKALLDALHDAKEYGSILNIENYDWELLSHFTDSLDYEGQLTFDSVGVEDTQERLRYLIVIGQLLAQKYDVVVTNPPYMGSSGMSARLSQYVKDNYPDSKSDLFAVFIERCGQMIKKNRFQAMITQHSWMFLSSFEKLRGKLLLLDTINMTHLGARAFEEIGGEVVQTTSFVLRNSHIKGCRGVYCRLIEPTTQKGKEKMFLVGENRYEAAQDNFSKIPSSPIAYWLSVNFISAFEHPLISNVAFSDGQILTGDNNKYLRMIWEVDKNEIRKDGKWMLHAKGGEQRRWYGNIDTVVAWSHEAINHYKRDPISRFPKDNILFRYGITWSLVSSSDMFSMRILTKDTTFNKAAATILFYNDREILYTLAYLNTIVARSILKVLNPTLNTNIKDILALPLSSDKSSLLRIEYLARECIQLSKADWDSYENSWDFKYHPLVRQYTDMVDNDGDKVICIAHYYSKWELECQNRFNRLKANEEELNRIFIEIYGLQDELTPEIADKNITVRKAELQRDIKSLLSYAVGCMFGRYSLDVDGLGYAGGEWDSDKYTTYLPDEDNCLPITNEAYFEDDIVGRLIEFVKVVYGKETLEENLDFIAQALGNKGDTSREIIRNYFLNDFIKDHIKIYQKRPIYWLFDSGKQHGFKALVYMHRWNADTVGNLRVEYLHKIQRTYESEIIRMQEAIDNSHDSREIARAAKRKDKLQKQLKETKDYDAMLAHIALSRIEIDLDDGVKVNYEKVQTGRDGKKMQILAKI